MLNQNIKDSNRVSPSLSHSQNLKRKFSPDTEKEVSRKLQKQSSHMKFKQSQLKFIYQKEE